MFDTLRACMLPVSGRGVELGGSQQSFQRSESGYRSRLLQMYQKGHQRRWSRIQYSVALDHILITKSWRLVFLHENSIAAVDEFLQVTIPWVLIFLPDFTICTVQNLDTIELNI